MPQTTTTDHADRLRMILDDRSIASDPEMLEQMLIGHTTDPAVAQLIAQAYANLLRQLLTQTAQSADIQERLRHALKRITEMERIVQKSRRENAPPLPMFVMLTADGLALVVQRGALETMEATPEFAEDPPEPGTFCLLDDEGLLSEGSDLFATQVPGVVRTVSENRAVVELNGRQITAMICPALRETLQAGDAVEVLESTGFALVTSRQERAPEEALSRYPRIEPWPGGFSGAAALRPEVHAAALRRLILPLRHPDLARHLRILIPSLCLLTGPSRTGKTVCIRCLAAELGVPAFSLSISNVGSEYVSVTPRLIRDAANMAMLMSQRTGQTVFLAFDDCEQLARQRGSLPHSSGWHDDITGELLGIVDMLNQKPGHVCIFLLTNREDLLDVAVVKRSVQLRFALPGQAEYMTLWGYELKQLPEELRPENLEATAAALTADIFTDTSWAANALGEDALQLATPAQLIDCSVPCFAVAEARATVFERTALGQPLHRVDLQSLRIGQQKIVVDGYRQLIKRANGQVLSDLNLLTVQTRA